MPNPPDIYLRALEPDDYKVSIHWRQDDAIWKQLLGEKHFVSAEYEKRWMAESVSIQKTDIRLGICLESDQRLIGLTSLASIDMVHRSARTQIMIGDKSYWGLGIGTQVLQKLLTFAFDERGLERIWCRILMSNLASQRLHRKAGYVQEGLMRKAAFKNGHFQDVVLMAILREDYRRSLV